MTTLPTPPKAPAFAEFVKRVPIFRDLDASTIAAIASALVPRVLDAGQQLFAEGDAGDAMYFIDSGAVRIHSGSQEPVILAELGPGQFFGEIG